jgi:Xaa-Pro aminopeptidase
MSRGCAREGYGSILAGGASATVLHYVFNDQVLKDGEMLLIDAGGEYQFYTGDITRTYPVNGKFNPSQKRVYSKVLNLQKSLIEAVKPNETRDGLQKRTVDGLVDVLLDENLLSGKKSEIIEKKLYQKYYMHGVSHWLGMDVHDAGVIDVNGEPRPLKPGFCLTIEPGLYVPADDENAPAELRGLGIRIEDDILVTDKGHENLTAACPKDIDALEGIIGSR